MKRYQEYRNWTTSIWNY